MRKSLFVWIPKVAGTSISKSLGLTRYKSNPDAFNNRGAVTFGHISINVLLSEKYMSSKFFNRAFKFCFVRNPWDRFISLYFYKRRNERFGVWEFLDLIKGALGVDAEYRPKNKHFDRNMYYSAAQGNLQIDWITRNGRLFPDFIGRYENLAEDFKTVCGELGVKAELKHLNKSGHDDYRNYYDEKLKKEVGRLYEKDIDTFKYTF